MTITLTPEAAAVLAADGEVWVAVDGESFIDWDDMGCEKFGPPAELVEALKPCRCIAVDNKGGRWKLDVLCPCHNGKRVIEVQIPWHLHLDATVAECLPITEFAHTGIDRVVRCQRDDGSWGWTVFRMVEPGTSTHEDITLYGNPKPGMYAVKLNAVNPPTKGDT